MSGSTLARVFLVRHGRPLVDPSAPASTWSLDPAYTDDVMALRRRLPADADYFSSPEVKALETATLLSDTPVEVVEGLREHERAAGWVDDFEAAVRRAFADPDVPAAPGWEPLAACRARVVTAWETVAASHPRQDIVLVGHGTAWTLLAAHLRREPPDLERWAALRLPDVVEV